MGRLNKNKEYYDNVNRTIKGVKEEINEGLRILKRIDRDIITFFGSHMVPERSDYYRHANNLAFMLGKKGFAIMSGGGPGIMKAASEGAIRAKTPSIGFKARLLKGEQIKKKIFTHEHSFHFLFVRRFLMAIKSEALIFYPGGYGTLNELFEYVVLMQTGIVDEVPIICVNKDYWRGLFNWLRESPLKKDLFIHDSRDLELIHLVDEVGEVLDLIKN